MKTLRDIIGEIELHSAMGIAQCFADGVSPNDVFNGAPLIYELTSEYTRTPAFKDCVKVFVDHGLQFGDKILLTVLLDDAVALTDQLGINPGAIADMYTIRCA